MNREILGDMKPNKECDSKGLEVNNLVLQYDVFFLDRQVKKDFSQSERGTCHQLDRTLAGRVLHKL